MFGKPILNQTIQGDLVTKYLPAFLMFLAMTGTAHAADPAIFGRWISSRPVFENGGILVKLGFDFKDALADMSTICYYPSKELEAVVTVPVKVEAGKINVLGAGEKKISENGFECNGTVDQGVVDYAVNGNVLKVTAGGQTMDFVRRQ